MNPVGLIVSSFRPSDDATLFGFLVPSNLFAITSLRQVAEILRVVRNNTDLAGRCEALAGEVEEAVKKYAIVEHPEFGKVYAFEVDGYGGQVFMDDANVPSLLALPFLGCVDVNDPVYQNTRRLVLSLQSLLLQGKGRRGHRRSAYWFQLYLADELDHACYDFQRREGDPVLHRDAS